MDFSFRNSFTHIKNLWAGEEVIRKQSSHREQGRCNLQFDSSFCESENRNGVEVHAPRALDSASFEFLHGDRTRDQNSLQFPISKVEDLRLETCKTNSPAILQHYQADREMAAIIGTYQHDHNENFDEYFKALGVPYIPRKMMGLASPRLEISNDGDKWTIRTVSMMRTIELIFTLGEEYEEHMPGGVTLKNVTTMEGDSLVTVSVGPDNNKVVRKYDVSEDGVVLTMTHENSGQVAKRYFKRLS